MISTLRVSLLILFCVFSGTSISHSAPSANATNSKLTGNSTIIDNTYSAIFHYVIRGGEESLTNLSNLAISPDDSASWSEISYSSFDHLIEEGSLSTIFVSSGKDYVVSDRLVLGVFGQLAYTSDENSHNDFARDNIDANGGGPDATLENIGLTTNTDPVDATTTGLGLLVGPYAILDLEAGIRLSGKLGYGESQDEIKPYGTYSDDFDVSRFLATGRISSSGYSSRAGWAISPSVEYMYYTIDVDEYRDGIIIDSVNTPPQGASIRNIIPSAAHSITRLDFGPTFSRISGNLVWSFGIKGSWSLWDSETNGEAVDAEDLSSRVDIGLDYVGSSGLRINFAAYHDGLGGDYDSSGISLGLNYNF